MASWRSLDEWEDNARFWLPEDPDEICYGRLRFTPSRGPEAHVVDSPLVPSTGEPPLADVPVLHGESLGGLPFALLGGVRTAAEALFGGPGRDGNTADVLFTTLVRGTHVMDETGVCGGEALVRVRGLLETLTGGKIDEPLLNVKAERDSHDELAVDLPFGSLTLGAGASGHISRLERRQTVGAAAHFVFSDEIRLPTIEGLIGPLRDLIVFATREVCFFDELTLFPARRERDGVVDVEQLTREVRILRGRDVEPDVERSSSYYALLLNPATVPDAAGLLVAWWALRERLGPVWTLLFATLQRPGLPLENQLLNLTAFAEGYHRTLHDEKPLGEEEAKSAVDAMLGAVEQPRVRDVFRSALAYANAQTQRKRLRWLAERATDAIAWDLDIGLFCRQIADTRNWLTHWGDRGKDAQEGDGLHRLIVRLDLVITVNVELDLGLDADIVATQVGSGMRLAATLP